MSITEVKATLLTDSNSYSDKKTKRNLTLDLARGLAVIFMVFVHTMSSFATENVQYSPFGYVLDFFGGPPAAPIFMFAMGVFFVLSSRSNSTLKGIVKGVKLLLMGIILSFLRVDIITLFSEGFKNIDISSKGNIIAFWEVDILQFAGCAYILMSIIKKVLKKPIWWLLIAVVIMLISPYLWGIQSNIEIINWPLNYLFGWIDLVYFPVFGWLFYPLMGMVFGIFMKRSDNINALFNSLIKPAAVILLVGAIVAITNIEFHLGDYFFGGPGSMILILGFVLSWLWLINKVIKIVSDNKIIKTVLYWGRNTTSIYIIHWLIICWGALLIGYESYGYITTVILMVSILAVTHFISKVIKIKI